MPIFHVFVLCGILISEPEYFRFRDALNELKNSIWGAKTVILHSRDIRKCEKEFSKLFDLKIKTMFYNELNALVKNTDFKILSSAIRKEEHIKSMVD